MHNRTIIGSAALVGLVLITGCSGGGAASPPTALPSGATVVSTSARVTASPLPVRTGPLTTGPGVLPGEKPPVEPDLAHEHSQAGGYAFATYFMRALSWSIATNDDYLLHQLSAPSCAACKRLISDMDGLHRRHETQVGGRPSIQSSRRLLTVLPFGAEVGIEYVLSDSACVIRPSGRRYPADSGVRSIVYLIWAAAGWAVREVAGP